MIIYMGNVEPTIYERDDPILIDIWRASQKLYRLVKVFIDYRLVNYDDPMDYLDPRVTGLIPMMNGDEFSRMMEPVLLLEYISYAHTK
jgi:hypothetical protein